MEIKRTRSRQFVTGNVFVFALVIATLFSVNLSFAVGQGVIGIAVEENISFPPNGLVTVYNGGPSTKAIVMTNSIAPGAVTLGSGMTINGDVVVGPGGIPSEVINDNGAVITGNVIPTDEKMFFVSVMVPEYLAVMALRPSINTSRTLTDSGKYTSIDLGHNEVLSIDGDISLYVTGGISLSTASQIVINPGSSLTLYLLGNLAGGNSQGFVNMTQEAANLKIYAASTVASFILKNAYNWYGTIYAPSADVLIDNGAELYGGVYANSFTMKNNGAFYFDVPEPATALSIGIGCIFAHLRRR